MKIKDILTIDLSEDIKNVIDLEDFSETEIQSEIENYIITDGLAKDYSDFVATFTSSIIETGVWISGFYGSGKSYFGKMLGYLLSNRSISGTPARDRIMQRFIGITDEALTKNSLAKLNTENCRVVFLDVAKQDMSKGLAFTLFRNFLKSLELPENEHGLFLYQLMINEKQTNIYDYINQNFHKNWGDIKTKVVQYAKVAKTIYIQQGNTESDYDNLITTVRRDIDQFSASRLKEELSNYLEINKGEKVIFLFDEASEAVSQQKFTLLDLEGISESLSALGRKVWTIAIAQEKLDDVISNANIDKAVLTKVTARFKTKIHLESSEVDVIIRNRLLNKKEASIQQLEEHYNKNSGKISDLANLSATGISKTDTVASYTTYYPFYKYQFNLLQNFLFGTKGYTSTKVAARGMIITTYDILKRELQEQELFNTTTSWQIAKQAQQQPDIRLVNRYENAEQILKDNKAVISGRKLLETINFLSEAEVVPTTISNIVKAFMKDPDESHKVQEAITKALDALVIAKILLPTNNEYRITTDIEQRLLDEMNGFMVQGFVKKRQVVIAYKSALFIKSLARITDDNLQYDFYITTDNDDELSNPPVKYLKLKLKSVYNMSDDRVADVEALKVQSQNEKDLIWLVPDNSSFKEMDKLIDDIERITSLEDKYKNPQSEEGRILRSFTTVKSEKENRLKDLVEQSLQKATAAYLYNTYQLSQNNWQAILQSQQRNVIQNVYAKRLASQLSDAVAGKVVKEVNDARLHTYFHGPDFQFFNDQGNFIGDKLKVVEEILFKMRNTFVDGTTLEKELEKPPTGFSFGTVISTVAALLRAGKVIAKYNGVDKFSWRDEGVNSIFAAAREFRKTSFKAIAKSLTALQKNAMVVALQNLNCEDHIDNKVDWNTNDFDIVTAVRELAKRFLDKVEDMSKQTKDFDLLFSEMALQKRILAGFTGPVSEANYLEKAEDFLSAEVAFSSAMQEIEKVEKFKRNNLPKLVAYKSFVIAVGDELVKAAKINDAITQLALEFNNLYSNSVVQNFSALQKLVQTIKDSYFQLMKNAAKDMAAKYNQLKMNAEVLIAEINTLPDVLNREALIEAKTILQYAKQRTEGTVNIEYDIKDKHTRFTYSDMLSYIELYHVRKTKLEIVKAGLITELPPEREKEPEPEDLNLPPTKKIVTTQLPAQKLKVSEYRQWLSEELQKVAGVSDNDEIEVRKG